jgi:methanogen extracellular protein (TIGR04279 family)
MRKEMALLLVICMSPLLAWADESRPVAHGSDPHEGGWIALEGTNLIKIPVLNVNLGMNWSQPFDYLPVYAENQPIRGTFWGPRNRAGSEVRIAISRFNTSDLLSAFQVIESEAKTKEKGSRAVLNSTGDARFSLRGLSSSGMYTVFIFDENSSAVLSMMPLLVTKGDLTLQMPANITAGDFARLRVNKSLPDNESINQSSIFAAILISRKDYENARLVLVIKGTDESLNSTLSIGTKSMQMRELPSLSMELLMQMLYLLPRNSTAGMQESKDSGADILLITDPEWEKGSYILTCGVYSSGKGLWGMKQEAVEVI